MMPGIKKLLLLILLNGIILNFCQAQIVKFIKNPYQAKYRVYITKKAAEANQFIFKVAGPTDIRKPGEWYIVSNPILFKNAMSLFEVNKIEEADIVVYFVSKRDSARIGNKH